MTKEGVVDDEKVVERNTFRALGVFVLSKLVRLANAWDSGTLRPFRSTVGPAVVLSRTFLVVDANIVLGDGDDTSGVVAAVAAAILPLVAHCFFFGWICVASLKRSVSS